MKVDPLLCIAVSMLLCALVYVLGRLVDSPDVWREDWSDDPWFGGEERDCEDE